MAGRRSRARTTGGWLVAVLLAAWPVALAAQHPVQVTPMSPSDPGAIRATALVELMIRGDQDEIVSFLTEHVASDHLERVTAEVRPVVAPLAAGGFRVRDVVRGPEGDLVVRLVGAGSQPELVVVRVGEPPLHRILAVARVDMARHGDGSPAAMVDATPAPAPTQAPTANAGGA